MDSQKHLAFTGAEANISNQVGTEFSVWDGYISGRNLDLEVGKSIVQKWRAQEQGWPENYFSEVTFEFFESQDGCELRFSQTGVPEGCYQGWIDYYWEPMEEYLKS